MLQHRISLRALRLLPTNINGFNYSQNWVPAVPVSEPSPAQKSLTDMENTNPLKAFFDSRDTGRGIWKWAHYFEIYHRHFKKFIGKKVNLLEIGVYSGGSMEMWRDYFGPNCQIFGVDIQESCRVYDNDYTHIFIGDQSDRTFLKRLKKEVPGIDIVIDDGSHMAAHQIVTLEEMLPHLKPGGVYVCEDLSGDFNGGFASYTFGLVETLNMWSGPVETGITPNQFQTWIKSISCYPYAIVIEKSETPVRQFIASRHGTEWQPY
jgi:hypothetical protein